MLLMEDGMMGEDLFFHLFEHAELIERTACFTKCYYNTSLTKPVKFIRLSADMRFPFPIQILP